MDPRPRRSPVALATALTSLLAPAIARADQFTMFDFTYEATRTNTRDAHYDVRPPMHMLTQPDNWTAPIDYTKGTVYIEQDVLTKPSMEETQVDICFLTAKGYGCRNTEHYFNTGRNTTVRAVTRFNDFDKIDWTKRIPLVQLIVKDKDNRNGGVPVEKFMPTKMRIAMTFVSAGATYTPPPGFPPPAGDGGATPTPTTDASPTTPDGPAAADGATAPRDASSPVTDTAPGARLDAAPTTEPVQPPTGGGPATTPDAGAIQPPPPPPSDPDAAAPPPRPRPRQSGGCTVAGEGTPTAVPLAALAALASLANRARRRKLPAG